MSEAAKSRKRKSISLEKKRTRWGYAFALPFAIGFVLFFLSPLILYFILGFSKLSLTGEGMQLLPVGLDNFRQVLFVQVGYFDSVLKSLGELLLTSPAIVLYSFRSHAAEPEIQGPRTVQGNFLPAGHHGLRDCRRVQQRLADEIRHPCGVWRGFPERQ